MKFTQRERKRGRPKKNVKKVSARLPLSPLKELKTMQTQNNSDYNSQPETTDESLHAELNNLGYDFDGELSSENVWNEDKDSFIASVQPETETTDKNLQTAEVDELSSEKLLNDNVDVAYVQPETAALEAELLVGQELLQIPLPLTFTDNQGQKISTKPPTKIHLVDGEKGGCGKSFVSRAFIEYCASTFLDVAVVDADTSNKDISRIYSGVEIAFFSDDERQAKEADKIFELAFEKSVIVNLPAQVYTNVTNWIQGNNLIELGQENSINFIKWFVCNGGVDSVNFFLKSLEDFGEKMTHVFVKNGGMCDDWKYIQEVPEFVAAQAKYNFTVMDFPKFPFWERNQVDRLGVSFKGAESHPELGVISKQRVRNFLKSAYAAFNGTGLIND